MSPPGRGVLRVGEIYQSVECKKCANIIPLGPAGEMYVPETAPKSIDIGCPFCGHSDRYPMSDIKNRALPTLPPEPQ